MHRRTDGVPNSPSLFCIEGQKKKKAGWFIKVMFSLQIKSKQSQQNLIRIKLVLSFDSRYLMERIRVWVKPAAELSDRTVFCYVAHQWVHSEHVNKFLFSFCVFISWFMLESSCSGRINALNSGRLGNCAVDIVYPNKGKDSVFASSLKPNHHLSYVITLSSGSLTLPPSQNPKLHTNIWINPPPNYMPAFVRTIGLEDK